MTENSLCVSHCGVAPRNSKTVATTGFHPATSCAPRRSASQLKRGYKPLMMSITACGWFTIASCAARSST
jgi:hypothetical protein